MSVLVSPTPAGPILVSEVGPRDGLQSVGRVVPTADKLCWIRALASAGLREIEVGAFVDPRRLPQMADAATVVRAAREIPGLTVLALAPNLRGVRDAAAAGAHRITMPVSASDAHSLANIGVSTDRAVVQVAEAAAYRDALPAGARPGIEVGMSTAFGCTLSGPVPEDRVIELAVRLARAGADSVGLSDGVGLANPAQVRRLFARLRAELGPLAGGAHLHDTRGQGLANVAAALEAGVTTIDAAQAGLGGCPYSPGATGNIVTEDLVWMLESMGLDTGVDLDGLARARAILAAALPGERLRGHVAEAGAGRGFRYAARGPTPETAGRATGDAPVPPAPRTARDRTIQDPAARGTTTQDPANQGTTAQDPPAPEVARPPPSPDAAGRERPAAPGGNGGTAAALPLDGVRVIEFSHMVMGPACGLVLADLGAEVIKVEPPGAGDRTRHLTASGTGFFAALSRNKKSVQLDPDDPADLDALLRLIDTADVLVENFRPGGLDARGLGHAALSARNPRLVYCSLKGFLPGPYEHRTALDEVVQMMSGLAAMTGPPGRPLRAGAPVNDLMGGLFGAVAVLAALRRRERTGRGGLVRSGLFETSAFLVSTHMLQEAITGVAPPSMAAGQRAWGVYDAFTAADGVPLFVGVVTDRQWEIFTRALGEPALLDPAWRTNTLRAAGRGALIPLVQSILGRRPAAELEALCERAGLPFARVNRPGDLYDDPHLNGGGALLPITLPDGRAARVPALPIRLGDAVPTVRHDLPAPGQHTREVLDALGAAPPAPTTAGPPPTTDPPWA